MLYNPPSGSTDPNAPYVGKDTAAGRQGSKLPPTVPEYTQREIVNAIVASGQSPSNSDLLQLWKAIQASSTAIVAARFVVGSTPHYYPTPGNYTLPIPAGTPFYIPECRAGGGGGGGADALTSAASGGGSGALTKKTCLAVTAVILSITVGTGGTAGLGGTSPTDGGTGGTSSVVVQSGTVKDTVGNTYTAGQTLCAATGGTGGLNAKGGVQTSAIGQGGTASGGDINLSGNPGSFPLPNGSSYEGGLGGSAPEGGGAPGPNYRNVGNTSTSPGVGGSGSSTNGPGGAGSVGRVTIFS